jgi:hypothetical protein
MRFQLAIVSFLSLIATATAHAKLITFTVEGSNLDCPLWNCDEFGEQTGLPAPFEGENPADFDLSFTLDTEAPVVGEPGSLLFFGDSFFGTLYSMDSSHSPGTGLSISIGNLTLFSSRFVVAIGSQQEANGLYTNALGVYSWGYPGYPEYWFELGGVGDWSFSPSYSIAELVKAPLADFHSIGVNPSGCPVRIAMPQWVVCGGFMDIKAQAVPEPSTIALFCLGLMGVGLLWCRPRKATTH